MGACFASRHWDGSHALMWSVMWHRSEHSHTSTIAGRPLQLLLGPCRQLTGSPLSEHPVSCTKQTMGSPAHDILYASGVMEGWFQKKIHTHTPTQQEGGFHRDMQERVIPTDNGSDLRKPRNVQCGSDAEQRPGRALRPCATRARLCLTHRQSADAALLCVGCTVWDVQPLLMRSALPIQ